MALFGFSKNRSSHVLGMNRRNLQFVYAKNPRVHFPLANDKLITKEVLTSAGIPVVETLCTFSSFYELADIQAQLLGLDEFVVKPAMGSAGRGIMVIAKVKGTRFQTVTGRQLMLHELRRHIGDIVFGVYAYDKPDTAIIEKRIHPHSFFRELYKDGLSDLRVIVVDGKPIMCMIRVPTLQSEGKANLHQGALGLGVSMGTGEVTRAWHRKKEISRHPDSNTPLLNRKVPAFEAILEISAAVGQALPLGYVGVDVVVDKDRGPLILEVNVRPGLEIQNVCGRGLRQLLSRESSSEVMP